jgi:uncharacterized membrane protein YidH (DUF202 family)
MRSILGIVLILTGVVLLVLGLSASDSLASAFSRFFTGEPTDRAIWLMLGGVVALAVGGALSWRGTRT